ncbi:hypothetical protein [Thalassospira alkalitolerans]|uniref:hypothetical protein n=1 Tax=Thalassospira alkalitolerans TaxID=1293890 RepID=UPI000A1F5910|nr:hypothetical protein [Thalassospira alkalitolerans]
MQKFLSLRSWATQLTIGSFLLMSGTGILLFFEFEEGLTAVVHQWLSWFFVIGAVAHIVINFRPFKNRLKSGWGKACVVVFGVAFMASCFSWGMVTGPQLERPIEEALVYAPLSALAAVSQISSDDLIRKLAGHGVTASSNQSIYDLSIRSGVDENELLGFVFLSN